jgi:hypothetical protein
MFVAASFKVSFDILPGAKPFDVVATGEAGLAVITIDQTTNSFASRFGGFMQIARAGSKTRTTAFRLYVDGKLIATKDVTYTVF